MILAGVGDSGLTAEDPRSIPEMVLAAVDAALDDAAVTRQELDAIVTASVDLYDGLTASNIAITEVVGAVLRPETRIAGDGLAALIHAFCEVRAGAADTVLVVAHGKASMADQDRLSEWTLDPIHLQPLGVDARVLSGLQARLMADDDEVGAVARWAGIAAERRTAAAGSGGVAPALDAAAVASSAVHASPLRQGMSAPLADHAVALVVRRADDAQGAEEQGVVRLIGVGHDLDAHLPGDRDLTRWRGLQRACDRAYRVAGIDEPASALSLAEPSCRHPHEEALFRAASRVGPDVPLSPSGGLFAGAAPVAAGLGRAAQAVRWLRSCGRPARALAHGAWGPAGQAHAVAILEVGGPA